MRGSCEASRPSRRGGAGPAGTPGASPEAPRGRGAARVGGGPECHARARR